MRGDFNSRMSGYAIARQNGWMSANEIRALEDMNRIPADQGGDLYLLNGNMITAMTASQKEKEVVNTGNEMKEGGANGTSEDNTGI